MAQSAAGVTLRKLTIEHDRVSEGLRAAEYRLAFYTNPNRTAEMADIKLFKKELDRLGAAIRALADVYAGGRLDGRK